MAISSCSPPTFFDRKRDQLHILPTNTRKSHIVEDINTFRRKFLQCLVRVLLLVIEGVLNSQLVLHKLHFAVVANASNDRQALVFGELTHNLPHCSTGSRHPNDFALFGMPDFVQGGVCPAR